MNLHPVWSRSTPLDTPEAIGRKARAGQRAREADESLTRLRALVRHESPELAAGSAPPAGQVTVDHIAERIQETSASAADWRNQHNFFVAAINRGNREGLWDLVAPNPFTDQPRDPLLRDEAFFRTGTQFVAVRQQFAEALGEIHRHEKRWTQYDPATLAVRRGELVVASAFLFGGFCDAKKLALLPDALRSSQVQQCGEQLWIDLRVPKSSASRLNLVGEDEALHRWCIDDLTAALLVNFLRHHQADQFPSPPAKNPEQRARHVVRIIRGLMTDLGISTPPNLTPSQWCQGAWGALEREPGASVPAYLAEYALGRTPSCSLPVGRWVALLNQRVSSRSTTAAPPAEAPPNTPSVPYPVLPTGTPDKNTQGVARRLLDALRDDRSKKLSRADCTRRLKELMHNQCLGHHVVANLLAHWAILLLSDGSSWHRKPLAPSTVYGSYLAPLVRPLISLLHGAEIDDIRDMDSDEFDELYSDVLNQTRRQDKSIPAVALQEFHAYLVTQHGVTTLDTTLTGTSRGIPRVRALIVTEAEYQATRTSIQEQYKNAPVRQEILEMALFLGFRAGLRPAEISKLRLSEIFVGPSDTVISVRTNRYGRNKNRPSLRRIDLAALCPDEEYQWFSGRVAQLHALFEEVPRTLLLSDSPNRDIRVDSELLRAGLQPMLRQITGNPHVVLYSLRHAALTRLHLRAEVPDRDHEIHDPQTQNPVDKTLVSRLTGGQPDSMKRLRAISAIAGHASPEMTLTTYLHSMDLVLHEKVCQTLPRLDAAVYAQLLGQSFDSTKRYLKDCRERDPAPASSLRKRIIKALPTKTHPPPTTQPALSPAASIAPPPPLQRKLTANDVVRILTDHDNGYPLPLIAKRSGFEDARCEAVINAAREIALILSKKGQPRFVSKIRREGFGKPGVPLAPAPPESEEDLRLANHMIERMRELLSKSGPLGDISQVIEYYLGHVEANNSGVRFYSPGSAKPFVELLGYLADDPDLIFGTHVYSEKSRIDAETQLKRWKDKLNIAVERDSNRVLKRDGGRYGKLTISLRLHTKDDRHASARAYKYVLHLAAIALLASRRIQTP